MNEPCLRCGFAADAYVTLPDPWEAYLDEHHDLSNAKDGVPLCKGCQAEMNRYLDPRHPQGGKEVDSTVREFLDNFDTLRNTVTPGNLRNI